MTESGWELAESGWELHCIDACGSVRGGSGGEGRVLQPRGAVTSWDVFAYLGPFGLLFSLFVLDMLFVVVIIC